MSERPTIFGSEKNFRALLKRYIASGEELLAQAEGVQKRIEAFMKEYGEARSSWKYDIEAPWVGDLRRWFARASKAIGPYMGHQIEPLSVIAYGLPPNTGKPRHYVGIENGSEWLSAALDEMRALQELLGVQRGVSKTPSPPSRFEELIASGLVHEKVVRDHTKAMAEPSTPRQLKDAIGSAKELTEATLRAALERLDVPIADRDDLPVLMKKWRAATNKLAPPDPKGEDSLNKAEAALASLVNFLGEWRNTYGSGHGRKAYPPGLSKRHARLASDAAEAAVRFVVSTMDDLELLPP